MKKEDIGLVLKRLRKASGLTQSAVGEKIGRKQQVIGHWETGYSQPDANTLFELCEIYGTTVDSAFGFSEKSSHYLGENEMRYIKKYKNLDYHGKKAIDALLEIEHERCTETPHIREEVKKYIPKFSLPMSAGSGEWDGGSDSEMVEVPLNDTTARATLIAPVSGDSMSPLYKNKDKVFIQSMPEIEEGEIGAWVVNGELFIKKLGKGELISVNPKFMNIPLNENDDVRCIGKVIGKV